MFVNADVVNAQKGEIYSLKNPVEPPETRGILSYSGLYLLVIRYRGWGGGEVNVVLPTLRDDNSSNCARRFLGETATVH